MLKNIQIYFIRISFFLYCCTPAFTQEYELDEYAYEGDYAILETIEVKF